MKTLKYICVCLFLIIFFLLAEFIYYYNQKVVLNKEINGMQYIAYLHRADKKQDDLAFKVIFNKTKSYEKKYWKILDVGAKNNFESDIVFKKIIFLGHFNVFSENKKKFITNYLTKNKILKSKKMEIYCSYFNNNSPNFMFINNVFNFNEAKENNCINNNNPIVEIRIDKENNE